MISGRKKVLSVRLIFPKKKFRGPIAHADLAELKPWYTLFDSASGKLTKLSHENSPFQSYLMHTPIRGEVTMPISLS